VECPDEETIAQFVQDSLPTDARAEVERHLDTCTSCAGVVVAFVQLYETPPAVPPPAAAMSITEADAAVQATRALTPGAAIGRYRILEIVGIGGMGVVYAAYDPELDRRVALKLLRGTGPKEVERRVRLVREAQAMARLTHPNVITVHDVGTHDDQVFVAMEFVQGRTMSAWLTEGPDWPQIRAVFAAAGRGLEAAHEAGIVHRDFKPDNVLIGDDGRVRVTDFGLAQIGNGEQVSEPATPDHTGPIPTASLTVTGAMLGTPAYMAPEQFEAGVVTPVTDQYSYCVALYEAVYGQRPHKARSLAELATAVLETRVERPALECKAPPHVRDAIVRGLSREPAARFPTMGALLAEVERQPRKAWRLAVAALPIIAIAGVLLATQPSDAAPVCTRSALAEVWNEPTEARLRAGFVATDLGYAAETWTRARTHLHAYAEQWLDLDMRACEARRADPSDSVAVLQQLCLQSPRESLVATLGVLEDTDAAVVDRAVDLVMQLPPLEHCGDAAALTGHQLQPPPPELREAVAAARADIAKTHALIGAAKYGPALELAQRTLDDVRDVDYVPIVAEATYYLAAAQFAIDDRARGETTIHEAAKLATASNHHEYAARCWLYLASPLIDADRYDEALRFVELGQAELVAWGQERNIGVALRTKVGAIHQRAGRYEDALAVYEGVEAEYAALGDGPRRADVLAEMGMCELELRRLDEGIAHYEESLRVRAEAVGPDHPDVGRAYVGIALTFLARGDLARARGYLETAEGILKRSVGPEHHQYINVLAQLGQVLSFMGEHDAAIEMLQRAVAAEVGEGPIDNARAAVAVASLAQASFNAQRFEDAARDARTAVEALERLSPEGTAREVPPRMFLALALLEVGEIEEALAQADRGVEVCRRVCPPNDVNFVGLLEAKARILTRQGNDAEAAAVLTEAIEIAEPLGGLWTGWIGFRWAEAAWADETLRPLALQRARAGKKLLAEAGDARLRFIERWLDEHDPG
jgi:tetratricopeptide (TPR) repeat protein